jgi:putative nucleotidyltransferase with HDIG domain
MELTRENAWALLTEFVQSDSLRRHCLSVETAVRAYARKFGENEDEWGFVALIHDFDFEIHPTLDQHPQDGFPILRERGVPEWVIDAVASHADHLDVPRDTPLKKVLAACDELTGFIAACAFVRPSKAVRDVTASSVRKKMKDKAFARAVDRTAMLEGAELLGVPFEEHVDFVIAAMAENAEELGLQGVAVV